MSDLSPTSTDTTPIRSDFADDADMMELVEFFVAEMPDRVSSLEAAKAESDLAQLRTLAHQLKGAAGGYGFTTISTVAGTVEHVLKDDAATVDGATEQIKALIDMCRRVAL